MFESILKLEKEAKIPHHKWVIINDRTYSAFSFFMLKILCNYLKYHQQIMIDLIYAFSGKRGKILRNQSKRSKLCTHVCHDVFTMLQYMWREDSIIPKWIAVLWVHLRLQIKATFSQRSALCVWDSMDCKNSVIQSVYVRIVIIRLISCSKLY